jgi:hypothetical protein
MPRPLDAQLLVWDVRNVTADNGTLTPLVLLGRGTNMMSPYIPSLMMASPCNMSSQLTCEGSSYLRDLDIVHRLRLANPKTQARSRLRVHPLPLLPRALARNRPRAHDRTIRPSRNSHLAQSTRRRTRAAPTCRSRTRPC